MLKWQVQRELRSLIQLTLDGQPSSVQPNDFLRVGQAQSTARFFANAIIRTAKESGTDSRQLVFSNPIAGVFHAYPEFLRILFDSHANTATVGRIFGSITQQVDQARSDFVLVHVQVRQFGRNLGLKNQLPGLDLRARM